MFRHARRRLGALAGTCAVALAGPAAAQVPKLPSPTGNPVIAAAGDIACDPESPFFNNGLGDPTHCRQLATSDLLVTGELSAVLPLGDIQYEDALLWKFERSYDPSWGRVKRITRPVIGNHEYFASDEDGSATETSGGAGYFDYFNGPGRFSGPAGDRDKGYYSYDIGDWHIVALNSVCSQIGGCGPGSPQVEWLKADLAANPSPCTLAYWHHPLFTSAEVGWTSMDTIWQVLHEAGAELVLSGHIHNYERFAPLNAAGVVDPAHGLRQFVVGSGGKNMQGVPAVLPASEALNTDTFGVLKLTLRPTSYEWNFEPVVGSSYRDAGSANCHEAPAARGPGGATGPATQIGSGSARLNASVDSGGQPATYRFEYGPTAAYGFSTPDAPLPREGAARQPVSTVVSGLADGTEYHYRVVVSNASGTITGADRTFFAGDRSRYADVIASTPGLLAHWRFGEPFGGTAFEEAGAYHGVYGGHWTLRRKGAIARDASRSASFGGPFGSMRAYGPVLSHRGAIEGWFRWRSGRVLMRDDSSQDGWYIARSSGGRLSFRVAGQTFHTRRPIGRVRDGAWHHIVLSKDGSAVALYIDGRRVFFGTGATNAPAVMPWHVMRNGPFRQHSSGNADELAFYDRPLPASTIRAHYRAGVRRLVPQTGISGLRKRTNDSTPVASLSASRSAKFRCALTRPGRLASIRNCGSTTFLSGLEDGRYSFTAYAVGRRGYADPTPAKRSFTVDTVRPSLTVQTGERGLRDLIRRGLPLTASCSEFCRLRARLVLSGTSSRRAKLSRGRPVEIGRVTGKARAGATARLRVRVSLLARKRMARLRAAKVTLRISATDLAGNSRGVRRVFTLRR